MGLNLYRIKKWSKMLLGKSILHVNQDVGRYFDTNSIKGYYNNLIDKVDMDSAHLTVVDYVPEYKNEDGRTVEFAISIFQYGLGCYDKFIESNDNLFLKKMLTCANWALDHQEPNGAFDAFSFLYQNAPYSAMCQGEACSLLLRAYNETNDDRYRCAAKKAIDFMLIDVSDGGVAYYSGEDISFFEYTNKPLVLNGWIFSLFGLFDACLAFSDEIYVNTFDKSLSSLQKKLADFDKGYWSKYDSQNMISSPFYHSLHIYQLKALFAITGRVEFEHYAEKFVAYKKNFWNRSRAFIEKAMQKLSE